MIISERFFASSVLCVTMIMAIEAPAFAVEPPPASASTTGGDPQGPFDEGRALMRSGLFAEAAQKFEESLAIKVTSGALLNLADCYEKLGRYASAIATFHRSQALSDAAGDPGRAQEARNRSMLLDPFVSSISVRVSPNIAGTAVTVDKTSIATDTVFLVDGGSHVVIVSAPCYNTVESRVTVGLRGDAKQIEAKLVRSEMATCNRPKPTESKKDGETFWSTRNTVTIAAGAAGVVGLAIGTAFGLSASGNKSDLQAACTDYPRGCPPSRREELDGIASDADTQATVSTIGFVAGALLLAGAAVYYFAEPLGINKLLKRAAVKNAAVFDF
jgi:hypothetical protein